MPRIRTQGIGDIYRLYLGSVRDGLAFNLAYIPAEFAKSIEERSGLTYMKKLYDYGFTQAKQGYPWASMPPSLQ